LIVLFCSPELIYDVAEAISYEVRAQWNGNRKQGKYQTDIGLSCFSPVINIMRHPLWGRNQVNILCYFAFVFHFFTGYSRTQSNSSTIKLQ